MFQYSVNKIDNCKSITKQIITYSYYIRPIRSYRTISCTGQINDAKLWKLCIHLVNTLPAKYENY